MVLKDEEQGGAEGRKVRRKGEEPEHFAPGTCLLRDMVGRNCTEQRLMRAGNPLAGKRRRQQSGEDPSRLPINVRSKRPRPVVGRLGLLTVH